MGQGFDPATDTDWRESLGGLTNKNLVDELYKASSKGELWRVGVLTLDKQAIPRLKKKKQTKVKSTALTLAAWGGHYDVVEMLTLRGGNPAFSNSGALKGAVECGHSQMVEFLLHYGAEAQPVLEWMEQNERKLKSGIPHLYDHLRDYLDASAKQEVVDGRKTVAGLLENGFDMDAFRAKGPVKRTGFIAAAKYGLFEDVVAAMVAAGATLDAKDVTRTDGTDKSVIDYLADDGKLDLVFDTKLWADGLDDLRRLHAELPENLKAGADLGRVKSLTDIRAVRDMARSRNRKLCGPGSGPA